MINLDRLKFRAFYQDKMYDLEYFILRDKYITIQTKCGHFESCILLEDIDIIQCIGESDIDNKLIYSGDILEILEETNLNYKGEKIKCMWHEGYLQFLFESLDPDNFCCTDIADIGKCKIIGNIYQNSELLEVR